MARARRSLLRLEPIGPRGTYRSHEAIPSSRAYQAFQRVPKELWREIMEHFDPVEQRGDLISCSVACRQLTDPSQRVLFKVLTLEGDHDLAPIVDKLTRAPHLAQYIRHVHVNDFDDGRLWSGNEQLEALLALCSTSVVKFSIRAESVRRTPSGVQLGFANTRVCESGLLFKSLASVQTIDIAVETDWRGDKISAIPEMLNCFPQLTTLVISHVNIKRGGDHIPSALSAGDYEDAPPVFSLKGLMLSTCVDSQLLNWLVPALDEMTYLKIGCETANIEERDDAGEIDEDEGGGEVTDNDGTGLRTSIKRWLKAVGGNLTHLTLDWTSFNSIGLSAFSVLECTPRVEILTILGLRMYSPAMWITLGLNKVVQTRLEHIQELVLGCNIEMGRHKPQSPTGNEHFWGAIQPTLTGDESSFRDVRLTLDLDFVSHGDVTDVPADYSDMYHNIEEHLVGMFSHFSSRNKLCVTRRLSNNADYY